MCRNQCKHFPVYAYNPLFHYLLQPRNSYQTPKRNESLPSECTATGLGPKMGDTDNEPKQLADQCLSPLSHQVLGCALPCHWKVLHGPLYSTYICFQFVVIKGNLGLQMQILNLRLIFGASVLRQARKESFPAVLLLQADFREKQMVLSV